MKPSNFKEMCRTRPGPGMELINKAGESVEIFCSWQRSPNDLTGEVEDVMIFFVNAAVDQEATGWYLTPENRGLKCLITKDSVERFKLKDREDFRISKVRVIRLAKSGRAIVVEIME